MSVVSRFVKGFARGLLLAGAILIPPIAAAAEDGNNNSQSALPAVSQAGVTV